MFEEINEILRGLLDGTVSLDYYQVERLPPFLRYYVLLVNEAFSRRLIDHVVEDLEVRIPVRFEDVEKMKVETTPYKNCYNEVLGRHRYAHVVLPPLICDEGKCVNLKKVKVIDVEGKVKEVDVPQLSFYVRQPMTEVVEGGKEGERKRIKNKYGRLKVILSFWVKGTRFYMKVFDVYTILRGHALIKRKDRLFVKKTRTGKVKVIEQRTKEGLFLEVYVVRELKVRKDEVPKVLERNEVLREEDGDYVKLYRYWQYFNRVYRKQNGKERRILKVYLKRPDAWKKISFGNQTFWVEHKDRYKYILRNLAQHNS